MHVYLEGLKLGNKANFRETSFVGNGLILTY